MLLLLSATAGLSEETGGKGSDPSSEAAARWHFNYAGYLIDVGKYLEALENYDTAMELSSRAKTREDALLGKAMLLAEFLDAADAGLKVYRDIEKQYPESAEIASYRQGLLLVELNRSEQAKQVLSEYLEKYPQGRFRFSVEALLESLKEKRIIPGPTIIGIPEVRVRICRRAGRCLIEGGSSLESGSSREPAPICAGEWGCVESFQLASSGGRPYINGQSSSKREFAFYSSEPMTVVCGRTRKRVRGSVKVRWSGEGFLVINEINIEDYLLSVVPAESLANWPMETLKAQAVASRTYAFYQLLHRQKRDYDLVADEGDQMYGGIDREHERSTRAIRETQGQILTLKGQPILAMYSANSGGYTADAAHVFDLRKPYLIAQPDPESLKGKMAHWVRRFKREEVDRKLRDVGITGNGLEEIQAVTKGPSGRVIKVRLIYRDKQRVVRTRTTLRRALKLPEILFRIQRQGDQFVFEGHGFGHGVGYSQWGSCFLGQARNYQEILEFYYPQTDLTKNW